MTETEARQQAGEQYIRQEIEDGQIVRRIARDPWPASLLFAAEWVYHTDHDPAVVTFDPESMTVAWKLYNGKATYQLAALDDTRELLLGTLQKGSTYRQVG